MTFLFFIICVGSGVIAFSVSNRRDRIDFERRNSSGVREYDSWQEAKNDSIDEGVSNMLGHLLVLVSCVSGLLCAISWAAG